MLHTLTKAGNRKKKRVGRGGARGTRSGRGNKGQRSRAGRKIRPALRDELARIPKRRGHNKNRARGVRTKEAVQSVTLQALEKHFKKDEVVTPTTLLKKGVVSRSKGRVPSVKIVVRGDVAKSLNVKKCALSVAAKQKIETAGGTVQ